MAEARSRSGQACDRRSRQAGSARRCGSPALNRWSRSRSLQVAASAVIRATGRSASADDPAGRSDDHEQSRAGEDDRRGQRPRRRPLVWLQREAGDDGAGALTGAHHGHRVEPGVRGRLVRVANRTAGERSGEPLDRARRPRPLDRAPAGVDPIPGRSRPPGREPPRCERDHVRPSTCRAPPRRAPRPPDPRRGGGRAERQVEAGGQRRERQRRAERDGDGEFGSKPEPSHRSW